MKVLVLIGFVISNYLWQFFNGGAYEIAFERSYFQAIVVVFLYLVERGKYDDPCT
jgi:hypothetical protein